MRKDSKMNKGILIFLGILIGVFFTNAIWLAYSLESAINLFFGVICLICVIIAYRKA